MPEFITKLDASLKVSDVITALSVLIALLGFLYARSKDRRLRITENADLVRAAAALTLAKVDRYESLLISFFHRLQPIITEADELIVRTKNEIECRDQFWRRMNEIRLELVESLNDEEIELSYAPLFGYHRDIYDTFRNAIADVKRTEEKGFWSLLNDCQRSILQMAVQKIASATLGNELREICSAHLDAYTAKLREVLAPIRDLLQKIILSSDKQIQENRST